MKNILGLDLGTNSIGWALVNISEIDNRQIIASGMRVIPMTQDELSNFDKGNTISKTAERTTKRGIRRLYERHHLRRERLHRVLQILGWLPAHYSAQIDFDEHKGKFKPDMEPSFAFDEDKYFLFEERFLEMVKLFPNNPNNTNSKEKLFQRNWTQYYLRVKGLSEKLSKQEIAWLLLKFNQKRGYNQIRGEEEQQEENKISEYLKLKVITVKISSEKKNKKGEDFYEITLENRMIYKRSSKIPLFDWVDTIREFILTTEVNADGSIKIDTEGKPKVSWRAPKQEDWGLMKLRTEKDIKIKNETPGQYIFNELVRNPNSKIEGSYIQVIDRDYYREELMAILEKQSEFHPEFRDATQLKKCIDELYPKNTNHTSLLERKDLIHLLVKDIIFYQRPLKSQKALISKCTLEKREWLKDGQKYPSH